MLEHEASLKWTEIRVDGQMYFFRKDWGFFILWTAINDGILFLLMEVLVIVEDWFLFVLYVYTDSSAKHDKEMMKILSSIIIIFC